MRKLTFLLGVCATFFTTSCKEPTIIGETANLELKFKIYYDGQLLEFVNHYDYQNNSSIEFGGFSFYLSDVGILAEASGFETELFEVAFMDFKKEGSTLPSLAKFITKRSNGIPTGNYTHITFGIGVPSELNATSPSDYSSTHSLGFESNYWSDLGTYYFSNLDGNLDLDGDNEVDRGFQVKSGTDDLYQKVTIPIQLNLQNNETGVVTFALDLKKLFESQDGSMVSVLEFPEFQNADLTFAKSYMQKFPSAIALE